MKSFLDRLKLGKLSDMGVKDFHTRQKVMLVVLIVLMVFVLFYMTGQIIAGKRTGIASYAQSTRERIINVQRLTTQMREIESNAKTMKNGLLSYVQEMGQRMGMASKIVNIKMVNATQRQEQVSFRSENLVYQDFTAILRDIEQYDNIWIKNVTVTRRFDNQKRIDASWELVRGE